MSKSASVTSLEHLHAATAEYLSQRLQDSTRATDDPDEFVLPLATGEVANILAFLKHNNITAAPDDVAIKGLADEFKSDLAAQRTAKAHKLYEATDEELEQAGWLH